MTPANWTLTYGVEQNCPCLGVGAGVAASAPVSEPGVCTGISPILINNARHIVGGKLCIFKCRHFLSCTMFSCELVTNFQGIWPIYMQQWNLSRSGPGSIWEYFTRYVVRHGQLKPLLSWIFSAKLKQRQLTWIPCEMETLCIASAVKHFVP